MSVTLQARLESQLRSHRERGLCTHVIVNFLGGDPWICHNFPRKGTETCWVHSPDYKPHYGRRPGSKAAREKLAADHKHRLAERGLPLRRMPTAE